MTVETNSFWPATTVTTGGTTAPAAGTVETWTVTGSGPFGGAVTGVTQFHVYDPVLPGELIAVTNTAGPVWTVTRGAANTTPVAHAGGFTAQQNIVMLPDSYVLTLAEAAVTAETTRAMAAEALLAPAVVGLTFAAGGTTLVNAAAGNVFTLTLTASTTTLGNPSNPADGQVIRFRVAQGTGGSYTLAYGSAYAFGTAGAPTLSTAAGKTDILTFQYVAALGQWCYLGGALGFGTGGASGWNVLQSAVHGRTSAALTNVVTPASDLSSGTKLVAVVVTQLGALVTGVQDAAGNSFTQQVHAHGTDDLGGISLDVWTLDTPSGDVGAAPAVTATLGTSARSAIWLGEVSGLLTGTTGLIDGTAGTSAGTAGTFPAVGPPSYSDATAGEFLLYAYGDNGVASAIGFTAPAGYTLDAHNIGYSTTNDLAVCYKSSTGGTETGAWSLHPDTFTDVDSWALVLAAFKLA